MPFLLRTVKGRKWYHDPDLLWLREGDMPADTLTDLRTEANKPSLWYVEDDKSNLSQC